jgi:DNA-binding HxlR family transcriptional regulator
MSELLLTHEPEWAVEHEEREPECAQGHHQRLLAMGDAMAVLGGKWKMHLIAVLSFKGKRRFSDLLRDLDGIGAKMLSKDLHELEDNQLITRTVLQTKPLTVEYEITEYGKSLTPVICEIISWGMAHRQHIMKG